MESAIRTADPSRNGFAHRTPRLLAAGGYLLFVVYGSLVPLDFHPHPLEAAWRDFLAAPYLALGVESRADWIANILLYIPLAYLLCAALVRGIRSTAGRFVALVLVYCFCVAVAIAVEFTQIFFPPRTVSLNDIVAECIGSALGIFFWIVGGGTAERMWAEMKRGGQPAIRAAVIVYVLAYTALALFPFDFLVSANEFAAKFSNGSNYGLIVARESCTGMSNCAGKLLVETLAVVPLGVLLSMVLGRTARRVYAIAAVCGLSLGLALEVAQLFLASGVSEGISLLTRSAGMVIGVYLHRQLNLQALAVLRPYAAGAVVIGAPVYLLALMWANSWFTARWLAVGPAARGLPDVHWQPFYYHYYTTETHALISLLVCVAMYLPVGVGYWVWTLRPSAGDRRGSALVPALIALPLALAMEMGKLFVPGKHPDTTDILIAMVAAAAGYRIAEQIHLWALQDEPLPSRLASPDAEPVAQNPPAGPAAIASMATALLLLCGTAVALWFYPLGSGWLALALAAYAALLWRYPAVCLPAVLGLLPLLNFAPWSGWILVGEFDLFVAVTLAVRLARPRPAASGPALTTGARWAIGLLCASFFASAMIGFVPLPRFDANALSSYYTSFNSLRELKGFLWAVALLPLLIEEARDTQRMDRRWIAGMVFGLCAVVAVIVWQRAAFSGLADFTHVYRVEGPFPELHTGGGEVNAYLVAAMPFVVAWIAMRPNALGIASGTLLFVLASYALGVTFTRGAYVSCAGALAVLFVAIAVVWWRGKTWTFGRMAIAAVLVLPGLAILAPIVSGGFMEARVEGTRADALTRTRHWAAAIDMRNAGLTTSLFGMGLGTFPKTALFSGRYPAPATFSFERDRGNGFVRMGSGTAMFLDQRVAIDAGKSYKVALDLRSADPNGRIDVLVCEKSIDYSFRCKETRFAVTTAGTAWEPHESSFDAGQMGSGPWYLRRPVVLSLYNSEPGTVIDIDNVRLTDERGHDLVGNGDFSEGAARWYFSADDHLLFHIKNLWVDVLFKLGWFGVFALAFAVVLALSRLAAAVWNRDFFAAFPLAALCGLLLTGLTESLFDGPRITTLFFLLLFAGLVRPAGRQHA